MGDYKPPFTITNEILSYVSSVSEKIGRITAISSLESKPHLRRNSRIRSIYASLKIEANSLSLGQVRDVINGKTVLDERKEIQEVKNAYAAYEKLSEINPYSIISIRSPTVMAEWQDYGIQLSFPDGSRYLNTFQLRVGLRSFKTNIMMRLPNAMQTVHLRFLLNLCCHRLIRFWMIFLFGSVRIMNNFQNTSGNCLT